MDDRQLWMEAVARRLDESWRQASSQRAEPFYARLLRPALCGLIRLAQVNPAGDQGFGPSLERRQLPAWTKGFELFFAYFTAKLFICTLVMHEYNQMSVEIQLTQSAQNGSSLPSVEPAAAAANGQQPSHPTRPSRHELEARLRTAMRLLDLLGSPWRGLHYLAEIGSAASILFMGALYLSGRVYVYKAGPIRAAVMRLLLDPDKERKSIHEQICNQADRFIVSNENYFRVRRRVYDARFAPVPADESALIGDGSARLLVARDTMRLVLANRLEPLNRRRDWVAFMQLVLFGTLIETLLLGTAIILLMLVAYPLAARGSFQYSLGPGDLLFLAETTCYLLSGVCLGTFYFLWLSLMSLDEIKFARELHKLIGATTIEIDLASERLAAAGRGRQLPIAVVRQLQMSVTAVLLQLWMFRAQVVSTKQVKGFVCGLLIALMPVTPALGRLILAHIDQHSRQALLVASMGVIMVSDIITWSTCRLHTMCAGIYRELAKLNAHLTATGQRHHHRHRAAWLASGLCHSQWLLRTELRSPDAMLDILAANTCFGRITYGNFIGIHFLCGLLLISFWFKNKHSTGNALADTLWLF
jgi:hypothetical protein